jgi:hypothetical protein
MRSRACQLINQHIDRYELTQLIERTKLIAAARAGDAGALATLQSKYGLRLPLLERRLTSQPGNQS